jgi:glycosyltransferase involved in cell wall biosynthesis
MADCDAVVQEAKLLASQVGHGQIIHLYPGSEPGTRFPRRWWGMQHLLRLRPLERWSDIHHIFNPDPYPFFVLRFLRRPVVYTAVAGLGKGTPETIRPLARQVDTIVVPTAADQARLSKWGITNVETAGPLIDVTSFGYRPPAADAPFTLMMGSAPWTEEQFHSKGVDALLEAARRRPHLHLIFLWRGVLAQEMNRRVERAGLRDRVQVLNKIVEVNEVLARAHATVVLAAEETLIKAYPHSLLESLAAGKPVLVSRLIPMAQMVAETGCGQVVESVNVENVLAAVAALEQNYNTVQRAALAVGQRRLSSPIDTYDRLYNQLHD